MKRTFVHLLCLSITAFLLWQCGTETTLYSWTGLDAANIDVTTGQPVSTVDLPASRYGIELNLNPVVLDKIKSAKFPASKDVSYNDRISSLRLLALNPVVILNDTLKRDTIKAGALLNAYFLADTTLRGAMLPIDTLLARHLHPRTPLIITERVYLKFKNTLPSDTALRIAIEIRAGQRIFYDTTNRIKLLK